MNQHNNIEGLAGVRIGEDDEFSDWDIIGAMTTVTLADGTTASVGSRVFAPEFDAKGNIAKLVSNEPYIITSIHEPWPEIDAAKSVVAVVREKPDLGGLERRPVARRSSELASTLGFWERRLKWERLKARLTSPTTIAATIGIGLVCFVVWKMRK